MDTWKVFQGLIDRVKHRDKDGEVKVEEINIDDGEPVLHNESGAINDTKKGGGRKHPFEQKYQGIVFEITKMNEKKAKPVKNMMKELDKKMKKIKRTGNKKEKAELKKWLDVEKDIEKMLKKTKRKKSREKHKLGKRKLVKQMKKKEKKNKKKGGRRTRKKRGGEECNCSLGDKFTLKDKEEAHELYDDTGCEEKTEDGKGIYKITKIEGNYVYFNKGEEDFDDEKNVIITHLRDYFEPYEQQQRNMPGGRKKKRKRRCTKKKRRRRR